jgi:hypothetical protein
MMGIFTILVCNKLHCFEISKLFKTIFFKEKKCDENEYLFGSFKKMKSSKLIYYLARDVSKPPRYYNIVQELICYWL